MILSRGADILFDRKVRVPREHLASIRGEDLVIPSTIEVRAESDDIGSHDQSFPESLPAADQEMRRS